MIWPRTFFGSWPPIFIWVPIYDERYDTPISNAFTSLLEWSGFPFRLEAETIAGLLVAAMVGIFAKEFIGYWAHRVQLWMHRYLLGPSLWYFFQQEQHRPRGKRHSWRLGLLRQLTMPFRSNEVAQPVRLALESRRRLDVSRLRLTTRHLLAVAVSIAVLALDGCAESEHAVSQRSDDDILTAAETFVDTFYAFDSAALLRRGRLARCLQP